MAWPTTAVATGDLITAAQLNGLPVVVANTTLAAPASPVTFTDIPGHYAHLLVVAFLRETDAVTETGVSLRLNNVSSAVYDYQRQTASAAAVTTFETFAASEMSLGVEPGASAGANLFSMFVVDIPHYTQAANNKDINVQCSHKIGTATTNMRVISTAGFWRSNAVLTRLDLFSGATSFATGSRITVIGVPG